MGIQLVVFDIAGTTVADKGTVNEVFRSAFTHAGIRGVSDEAVNAVMGYRKIDAIRTIVEKYKPGFQNDEAFIERIHDDFSKRMVSFYETTPELQPMPYAEKVFKELKYHHIKVALNTGFTRTITTPVLKRLGWDNAPFIDEVICSDEVEEGRPMPFMLQQLMKKLGIAEPEEVAKVGDTIVDIQEGINAGCGLVIAVTTGACSKEELLHARPDFVIDSLAPLPSLLL